MGIPVKNLGTAEIQQAQQQAQAIASAATLAVQPGQFVFFAAFDGTNNNRNNLPLSGTKQPTNVGQLAYQVEAAAISDPNLVPRYYPGPGTEGTITGSSWAPPMVTQQIKDTATQAYNEFNGQAAAWLKANPGGSLTTAITGFSRGGATAVVFAQMLNERGVIDTETGAVLIRPGQVPVAAMLLFDPVSTGYLGDLTIPACQQTSNLVVIRADNEYRYAFKADDHSANPNVTTIQAQGNHGDIGGFYDQGLGSLYLQGATNLLGKAGIPIGAVPPGRQFKTVDAALHSEGIDAYDNIIWSEYDASNGRLTRPICKPIPIQTIATGNYSATSTLNEAGQLVMTVERQINGHAVKIEFTEDEWGDLKASRVVSVDGKTTASNAFAQLLDSQGYDAWGFANGASAQAGAASLDALYRPTLTTSDAWVTTETAHLTQLKNSATGESITIYKTPDLLANRQAGDVVQITPQADGGKAIASYDAGSGLWLTEKKSPQGQITDRFTSSDNPLDAADPSHDGFGLWSGDFETFTTADFDSINAATGLPDYTRYTTYSDTDRDGRFDNVATQYGTGTREVTQYNQALDGRHATTATWLPNQTRINSLVLQTPQGLTAIQDPAALEPAQRYNNALYSINDIAGRLDQFGLIDQSADFLGNGFTTIHPANAGLDAYRLGDYLWAPTSDLLLDLSDAWYGSGNGALNQQETYRLSSVVDDAIAYLGSSQNHVSPLILDLDGDGYAERVGWTKDALLARDNNGNGRIDDITELYGDDQMTWQQRGAANSPAWELVA